MTGLTASIKVPTVWVRFNHLFLQASCCRWPRFVFSAVYFALASTPSKVFFWIYKNRRAVRFECDHLCAGDQEVRDKKCSRNEAEVYCDRAQSSKIWGGRALISANIFSSWAYFWTPKIYRIFVYNISTFSPSPSLEWEPSNPPKKPASVWVIQSPAWHASPPRFEAFNAQSFGVFIGVPCLHGCAPSLWSPQPFELYIGSNDATTVYATLGQLLKTPPEYSICISVVGISRVPLVVWMDENVDGLFLMYIPIS